MRLQISAVGRMKPGPERSLFDDYQSRFDRTGRALSLGPLTVSEVDERKGGGKAGEGRLLSSSLPEGAYLCALDERGKTMTSPEFAAYLTKVRDNGARDLVFAIGGADGLDNTFVQQADQSLSLGKMVWPHMLARVMLAEQLYRAASILAGLPYHKA